MPKVKASGVLKRVQGVRITPLLWLFLLFVLFLFTFSKVSQRQQITHEQSKAINTIHCPGLCKGESQAGSYIAGFSCINSSNQCATCQSTGSFSTQPLSICTSAPAPVTVGPAGSCDSSDKTYLFQECCAEGKSRLVTRTCQNNQFSWNVGSCTQSNGGCTQGKQTGIYCPANTAYYKGTCYPIGQCQPQCAGKACGAPDGCSGVCVDQCSSQAEADSKIAGVQTYGMKYAYSAMPRLGGYYTNLCGDTLTATKSCNNGCNPATGVCTYSGPFVVKWTCSGKAIECRENESAWATSQSLGNVQCGKTVAITLFSKNCRSGGGWSCGDPELLDYMVWYTGDCNRVTPTPLHTPGPTVTPVPTSTPQPTSTPRPTSTPVPTPTRTPTAIPRPTPTRTPTPRPTNRPTPTRTPTPAQNSVSGGIGGFSSGGQSGLCNSTCTTSAGCISPNFCIGGSCRNPSCFTDTTCTCQATNQGAPSAFPTQASFALGVIPQAQIGCGDACTYPLDCRNGFSCISHTCRNASCPQNPDCSCATTPALSGSPVASPTAVHATKPSGAGTLFWFIVGAVVVVVGGGILAIRFLR